jgi:hypothetical protein
LRFADDIVIIAETLQDLQLMLNDLVDSSVKFNKHGLPVPIVIRGADLKVVQKYFYLGQTLQSDRKKTI